MTLPRLCWASSVAEVSSAVSSAVAVGVIAAIGVAGRDHVGSIAIIIDARSSLATALSSSAVVVLFFRLCSVNGIFAVSPPVGDVHEVFECFGLDAPEFLLEVLALDAVPEASMALSSEMCAAEFFVLDQRSMYERMDSPVR